MGLINSLSISSPSGVKNIEIYNSDISLLKWEYDLLVISSHVRSYNPSPNTLIRSLQDNQGIVINDMASEPELDLRQQFSCWLGEVHKSDKMSRILCLEGIKRDLKENANVATSIDNLFGVLSLLSYKGVSINKIVMPVLGAGVQNNPMDKILPVLLEKAVYSLKMNSGINSICFVEKDAKKAQSIDKFINRLLQRDELQLSNFNNSPLISSRLKDVGIKIDRVLKLNNDLESNDTIINFLDKLNAHTFKFYQFGILSRRILELLLFDMSGISRHSNVGLHEALEILKSHDIPQWIVSCIHNIRTLGNAAAHSNRKSNKSSKLTMGDIEILVFSMDRFLQFYIDFSEFEGGEDARVKNKVEKVKKTIMSDMKGGDQLLELRKQLESIP